MPIEVHCPNPVCARVHLVKNRYSGMRGKCPACQSWMYVPRSGGLPSAASPRPEELEETSAWRPAPAAAANGGRDDEESPPARSSRSGGAAAAVAARAPEADEAEATLFEDEPLPPARGRGVKGASLRKRVRAGVEEDEEGHDEDEGEERKAKEGEEKKPKRGFSYAGAAFLILGMLGLVAVGAAPFLAAPEVSAAGEFAKVSLPKITGLSEEQSTYVMGAAGGVAVLTLFLLLIGMLAGRFGVFPLLLLYPVTVATAGILFVGLFVLHRNDSAVARFQERVHGMSGLLTFEPGLQLYTWVGGAGAATLAFILAAVILHRRWSSRVFALLFLGGLTAFLCVWVYRGDLGLGGGLLDELKPIVDTLPF